MLILTTDIDREVSQLVSRLRRTVNSDVWDGRGVTPYMERCRHLHYGLGVLAIFTRDMGHHSSGWWKNPDYERCKHLSLSFFDPETREPTGDRNVMLSTAIISLLFGKDKRLLWCEPPYSDDGKQRCVWHYRLFCDPAWEPILPRGEVYNRELTEAGWLSYSDVQAALSKQLEESDDRPTI